ncbi:tetratricopeptide repeat protein [Psychroflexus sp. ALD_RP9]|uniref:tetratricopeptide repeat protein n=1 Tax=Psychroflexus sp. ALD_RP9 TaxID=2777186 RepID=UPI001A8EBD69|nr:tetratricopeptide repeat protein [Psychroflexus sp. ALD_RP9]QSS97919.1 hypothetical protein IMZ30_04185 [Psychroflexus sp. ALD_RP9]
MKHVYIVMFCIWGFVLQAQNPDMALDKATDDLGNVTDEFQELFFKAIAQTAINNPAKAIKALQQCKMIDSTQMAVYNLLGKNYQQLKDFKLAETAYQKALKLATEDNKKLIRRQLFNFYLEQKSIENAIKQALILSETDFSFKQELANLYLLNQQPQKALDVLHKIEQILGYSDYRDQMRLNIYMSTAMLKEGETYFLNRLKENTYDMSPYLALLELYTVKKDYNNIVKIGNQAKEKISFSDQIDPYLAQTYMLLEQPNKAKKATKNVVQSRRLTETKKLEVIKAYKRFTANDKDLQQDLLEVLNSAISTEEQSASKAELAQFYKTKNPQKAYGYFKEALDNKPQDFKLYKEVINLGLLLGEFSEVLNYTNSALELFPAQPVFYYAKSAALYEQNNIEKALQQLDMGFSLLVGQPQLQQNFHTLYIKIYKNLDQPEKIKFHQSQLKN